MKFSVLSFGCRANQADACRIERDLRAGGGLPAAPGSADVVVVNTCSVTAAADAASRRAIRGAARANPRARIVATGCYATRRPADVAGMPGVRHLVTNADKVRLAEIVATSADLARTTSGPTLRPGDRGRTAYPLSVQTGCDERCAYCIVPSTRGPGRSRAVGEVLDQVQRLAAAGFRELWLTGVHLGSYGRDLVPRSRLIDLLLALDHQSAAPDVTFRLSSLEPMDCGEEIIDLVAGSPRFAPHLHLPLQHASDRMLSAMRRPYSATGFRAIVERARARMPDVSIGTDVIAGFPGETEHESDELAGFLREVSPSYVHVFPYSDRPGTEAAAAPSKIPGTVVRQRAERLRGIARDVHARFVRSQVGRERPALTLEDGTMALTDNYLKVRVAPGLGRNERVRVRILGGRPLRGEVVA